MACSVMGCGEVHRNPPGGVAGEPSAGGSGGSGGSVQGNATSGASAGGASTGGITTGGTGLGGTAGTHGGAANGGAGGVPVPASQIQGRWAMFVFEDPVGVNLFQRDDGELAGEGCVAGVPPIDQDFRELAMCGPLSGSVTGNRARFGFESADYFAGTPNTLHYSAEVTVSADGERMTGLAHAVQQLSTPTSWRRVAEGETWLPYDSKTAAEMEPLAGRYVLRLVEDVNGADEYAAGRQYLLGYGGRGIWGDLGSFWQSELEPLPGEGVKVGPVSITLPALPTEMRLKTGDDGFAEVEVITGSGNTYRFSAERTP
jgi:hypothetical protein